MSTPRTESMRTSAAGGGGPRQSGRISTDDPAGPARTPPRSKAKRSISRLSPALDPISSNSKGRPKRAASTSRPDINPAERPGSLVCGGVSSQAVSSASWVCTIVHRVVPSCAVSCTTPANSASSACARPSRHKAWKPATARNASPSAIGAPVQPRITPPNRLFLSMARAMPRHRRAVIGASLASQYCA